MALGNANTSAQARGKNVATKRKRRKETIAARNYRSFSCGPKAANHPASCSGGPLGNVFTHNGSSALPTVNDIVYTSKRARNPNSFEAGFYKVDGGGGRFKALEIDSAGVVTATHNC